MTKEEMLAQVNVEIQKMMTTAEVILGLATQVQKLSELEDTLSSLEILNATLKDTLCDTSVRPNLKQVQSILMERTQSRLGMVVKTRTPGAGRKMDPNSARQRVWAAVKEVLARVPKGAETEKFLILEDVRVMLPDLNQTQIETNMMDCPGVMRAHGFWSLE